MNRTIPEAGARIPSELESLQGAELEHEAARIPEAAGRAPSEDARIPSELDSLQGAELEHAAARIPATADCIPSTVARIPAAADYIMKTLEAAGYEAYLVGGCVRDTILGRTPGDYDITTSATPAEIEATFSNENVGIAGYGRKHGTVVLIIADEPYEVTTYRIDGEYSDNRRPDSVSFTRNIADDLARRDFTVNAMAMSRTGKIIDLYGGITDLSNKIIRAVGNPDVRFGEDALRILRGVRFAAQLGFDIEEGTSESIIRNRELLRNISAERIRVELVKTLVSDEPSRILRKYRDVFATAIPEIAGMFDFDQCNPFHCYDVYEHTLHAVDATPPEESARLAAFLHDIGKPSCFVVRDGWGHFYEHEEVSADMAESILTNLKFDNKTKDDVVAVIRAHGTVFNPTPKYARRKLGKLGEERLKLLIELERADVSSQAYEVREERIARVDEFKRLVDEVIEGNQCFSLKDLAINGHDVMKEAGAEGPEVGRILQQILDLVVDGELENDRELLLTKVRELGEC